MILRRLNPATAMRIGMASLVASLIFPRLVHPTAGAGPDLIDAIRGFLFGIAIAMNLMAVAIKSGRNRDEGR